ncbi:nidogen-2-like [Macrobrachium nipponense]|uniref:nidogen-2-like n=1 Tax=Macrobrachium nipponense TaxID=159736 RepID=UPI0030C7F494
MSAQREATTALIMKFATTDSSSINVPVLPGFAWDGSRCEDVDECSAQGKAECSAQATCRNSVGSYSCSCNPPFEGDGRTCEFSCESPAKVVEGLGCVKHVKEMKTFQEMNATCHEAGWRLLQDSTDSGLQEVRLALLGHGGWLGVLMTGNGWRADFLYQRSFGWEAPGDLQTLPGGVVASLTGRLLLLRSKWVNRIVQISNGASANL